MRMVVPRDEVRDLAVEVRVPGQVKAPIAKGQVIGAVVVRRGAEEVARVDVLAPRQIDSVGLLDALW